MARPPTISYAIDPPRSVDLAVVGGGIAGCAVAFFAARAGLTVAVLERRPRLGTLTTAAATGAFRLQFDNREELELVREGVALYTSFAERTGLDAWSIGLRRNGYLFCSLGERSAERARALVDRQRGWGLADVELLDGEEARRRFPYLSADVRQARFRAGDGFLDQLRLVAGYATAASSASRIPDAQGRGGASFVTSTEVVGFAFQGGRVAGVATSRGSVAAAAVVIAAGPFSGAIARLAGLDLDIRPTIRQKLVFPALAEVPPDAPMTIEDETGAHWRPALHGCFALWTDNAAVPGRPLDPVPATHSFAFGLLDPASDHALARLAPFWREVWERGSDAWYLQAGQYEYTPDHRPFIGPTPVDGLHVNAGYSGHGVMASAGGARRLVDLLVGRDDTAENPFRFGRPLVEYEGDVL